MLLHPLYAPHSLQTMKWKTNHTPETKKKMKTLIISLTTSPLSTNLSPSSLSTSSPSPLLPNRLLLASPTEFSAHLLLAALNVLSSSILILVSALEMAKTEWTWSQTRYTHESLVGSENIGWSGTENKQVREVAILNPSLWAHYTYSESVVILNRSSGHSRKWGRRAT